jgi:hypothetical protein
MKLPFLLFGSSEIKRSTHSEKMAAVPAEAKMKSEKLPDLFFRRWDLSDGKCQKKGRVHSRPFDQIGGADGSRTHGL